MSISRSSRALAAIAACLAAPATAGTAVAAQNERRRIVLDDAVSGRLDVETAPYLTQEFPVRVGDELLIVTPTSERERTERRLALLSREGRLASWRRSAPDPD